MSFSKCVERIQDDHLATHSYLTLQTKTNENVVSLKKKKKLNSLKKKNSKKTAPPLHWKHIKKIHFADFPHSSLNLSDSIPEGNQPVGCRLSFQAAVLRGIQSGRYDRRIVNDGRAVEIDVNYFVSFYWHVYSFICVIYVCLKAAQQHG